jgi:hypothetical protein
MKPWNVSEIQPKHSKEPRLQALARRLRDWLDGYLKEAGRAARKEDMSSTVAAPLGNSSSGRAQDQSEIGPASGSEQRAEVSAWNALPQPGPPEDWLRLVRAGAPELLRSLPEGGTPWSTPPPPAGESNEPQPEELSVGAAPAHPDEASAPVIEEQQPIEGARTPPTLATAHTTQWTRRLSRWLGSASSPQGEEKKRPQAQESSATLDRAQREAPTGIGPSVRPELPVQLPSVRAEPTAVVDSARREPAALAPSAQPGPPAMIAPAAWRTSASEAPLQGGRGLQSAAIESEQPAVLKSRAEALPNSGWSGRVRQKIRGVLYSATTNRLAPKASVEHNKDNEEAVFPKRSEKPNPLSATVSGKAEAVHSRVEADGRSSRRPAVPLVSEQPSDRKARLAERQQPGSTQASPRLRLDSPRWVPLPASVKEDSKADAFPGARHPDESAATQPVDRWPLTSARRPEPEARDPWPALPDDPPRATTDWAQLLREAERLRALDLEQRGGH